MVRGLLGIIILVCVVIIIVRRCLAEAALSKADSHTYLAESAVWSEALSEAEILALYAGASSMSIRPHALQWNKPKIDADSGTQPSAK